MKRTFMAALVALCIILAGVGYWQFWRIHNGPPGQLRLMGHIEATETDLAFKVPGIIAKINFQEGDYLQIGQVVAELDAKDLRDEVAAAEARVGAAQAVLKRFLTGSRVQEIAEARAAVLQAQADLENKRLDNSRMEGLLKRGAVPVSRRDSARAAYLMAEEVLRRAEENYSLVKEGPRKEDIDQAKAELKQAQANLELTQTRLNYATLTAPVNGVVLARPAEPGEVAAIGSIILTTGDLDNVYLEAYIPELDLARVRLGQKAVVTTDSYPDKKYAGWVSFINAKAEFTPKTVETFKERVALVYRTKIRVENPHYELKPGMPAEAVILLEDNHTGARYSR
ncbi:efflux RND transporter periplasmic adaptor subunit [Desulfobacca acetoxidans]|uniref:Secretion protein HlyD family protein n=1 Tax=Desulfobacca acetoxidans (strain ATCC 700848 / DSM 11109 / ASRB2) TaxID=880072 RepID=F2NIW5_DESAR|nr:efflux RND transporter periplasmic adaptor subunit [Desulfobacca acetoxidans]AEB10659.1 secretion protein HlyD family protein [Desulfobacca acetoxidans DSM 11109]